MYVLESFAVFEGDYYLAFSSSATLSFQFPTRCHYCTYVQTTTCEESF